VGSDVLHSAAMTPHRQKIQKTASRARRAAAEGGCRAGAIAEGGDGVASRYLARLAPGGGVARLAPEVGCSTGW